MALQPVGPLPASTYWRRRVVLLLGVVVLLLLLRSCAGGDATPKRKTAATSTGTPTPSVTRTAGPPATSTTSTTATPAASAAGATRLCPDAGLTVTAATDADSYAVGATPKITLVVKNRSAASCRRDLGAKVVELLVYSGNDRIWSSDDCADGRASSLVTLPAGGTQAVVKTWSGRRSRPGCTSTATAAAPAVAGTYRVVARLGTLRQEGAAFRLHA